MNQFYYTRKEISPAPKDSNKEVIEELFIDSFAVDSVLRTVQNRDGSLLVALKDGHEESRPVGREPAKNGREGALIKARIWVQSQITLEGEDVVRFRNLTRIPETTFSFGNSVPVVKSPTSAVE